MSATRFVDCIKLSTSEQIEETEKIYLVPGRQRATIFGTLASQWRAFAILYANIELEKLLDKVADFFCRKMQRAPNPLSIVFQRSV